MICNDFIVCLKGEKNNCLDKKKCIYSSSSANKRACSENKKRYNLENIHNFLVDIYHIDGGVIREEKDIIKCDFLYKIEDEYQSIILIELKGVDIDKAINQIDNTLVIFKDALKNKRIFARIIHAGVPRIYNTCARRNLELKLKKINGNLKIKEISMNERYDKLDE